MRRPAVAIVLGWTALVVISCAKGLVAAMAFGQPYSIMAQLFDNGSWWYGWMLATPVVIALSARVRLDDPAVRVPAVAAHLSAAFVVASAQLLASAALWAYTDGYGTMPVPHPAQMVRGWYATMIVPNMLTYAFIAGLYYAYDYNRRLKEAAVITANLAAQGAMLREQRAEAQLTALRMELTPHFLFNTLNSIVALVRTGDAGRADAMLVRLSALLRATLDRTDDSEVTLEREVAMLEMYLDIERVRFADRLTVALAIDEDAARALVPPLVLQPLVENAMKHGIAQSEGQAMLRISARREADALHIEVTDSGPGVLPSSARATRGIGLSNVRQRLQALYGEDASLTVENVTGGGARAWLTLPYRTAAEPVHA